MTQLVKRWAGDRGVSAGSRLTPAESLNIKRHFSATVPLNMFKPSSDFC